MNTIVVRNVSKSFREQKVLNDINMICQAGQIYGIVGYNGSGKSVLFKCICGFLKLDSGSISVLGKTIGKDLDILNAGIIIEGPSYLSNLSGLDNLDYLYNIRNKKNKQHLVEIMKMVGLDPSSRKKVCKYSMGMKQRLAIAQAIMEDQEILILDEPMNGLDKKGIEEMRCLFLKLKEKGKTILLASHNKDDIEILCDKVYELDCGTLVAV